MGYFYVLLVFNKGLHAALSLCKAKCAHNNKSYDISRIIKNSCGKSDNGKWGVTLVLFVIYTCRVAYLLCLNIFEATTSM